jgi:hypothetical protein
LLVRFLFLFCISCINFVIHFISDINTGANTLTIGLNGFRGNFVAMNAQIGGALQFNPAPETKVLFLQVVQRLPLPSLPPSPLPSHLFLIN